MNGERKIRETESEYYATYTTMCYSITIIYKLLPEKRINIIVAETTMCKNRQYFAAKQAMFCSKTIIKLTVCFTHSKLGCKENVDYNLTLKRMLINFK